MTGRGPVCDEALGGGTCYIPTPGLWRLQRAGLQDDCLEVREGGFIRVNCDESLDFKRRN